MNANKERLLEVFNQMTADIYDGQMDDEMLSEHKRLAYILADMGCKTTIEAHECACFVVRKIKEAEDFHLNWRKN